MRRQIYTLFFKLLSLIKISVMKDKVPLKLRLLIYFYGAEILEALSLDFLLKHIKNNGTLDFSFNTKPIVSNRDLQQDLDFLVKEAYLKLYNNNCYGLEKKGGLKLASGGFVNDAKKSKNALFAFRISIIAVTFSIISFLVSLFSD